MNVQYFMQQLQTIAPVDGVMIGNEQDKSTWRIDYAESVTVNQKQAVSEFIAAFDPTAPIPDDVRAEAQRRMIILVNAKNSDDLNIKIQNGLREAARLLQKEIDGITLTQAEIDRKNQLKQIDAAIENIRAKSNILEVMNPIPSNYTDDSWWI